MTRLGSVSCRCRRSAADLTRSARLALCVRRASCFPSMGGSSEAEGALTAEPGSSTASGSATGPAAAGGSDKSEPIAARPHKRTARMLPHLNASSPKKKAAAPKAHFQPFARLLAFVKAKPHDGSNCTPQQLVSVLHTLTRKQNCSAANLKHDQWIVQQWNLFVPKLVAAVKASVLGTHLNLSIIANPLDAQTHNNMVKWFAAFAAAYNKGSPTSKCTEENYNFVRDAKEWVARSDELRLSFCHVVVGLGLPDLKASMPKASAPFDRQLADTYRHATVGQVAPSGLPRCHTPREDQFRCVPPRRSVCSHVHPHSLTPDAPVAPCALRAFLEKLAQLAPSRQQATDVLTRLNSIVRQHNCTMIEAFEACHESPNVASATNEMYAAFAELVREPHACEELDAMPPAGRPRLTPPSAPPPLATVLDGDTFQIEGIDHGDSALLDEKSIPLSFVEDVANAIGDLTPTAPLRQASRVDGRTAALPIARMDEAASPGMVVASASLSAASPAAESTPPPPASLTPIPPASKAQPPASPAAVHAAVVNGASGGSPAASRAAAMEAAKPSGPTLQARHQTFAAAAAVCHEPKAHSPPAPPIKHEEAALHGASVCQPPPMLPGSRALTEVGTPLGLADLLTHLRRSDPWFEEVMQSQLNAKDSIIRAAAGVGEGRRYCDEPIVDVGMRALAAVQLLKDIAFELRSAGLIQNGTDVFQFEEVTAAAHQLRVQRAVGESTYDWLCRIHMSLHGQGAP